MRNRVTRGKFVIDSFGAALEADCYRLSKKRRQKFGTIAFETRFARFKERRAVESGLGQRCFDPFLFSCLIGTGVKADTLPGNSNPNRARSARYRGCRVIRCLRDKTLRSENSSFHLASTNFQPEMSLPE
mgnify:CR=1 FL=1